MGHRDVMIETVHARHADALPHVANITSAQRTTISSVYSVFFCGLLKAIRKNPIYSLIFFRSVSPSPPPTCVSVM